jgi:peptidoglycan hydrolase-like protein with peptidoglycan-binding domain
MKKFLIAATVATLAIASVASAASFNVNLTVGSTGADVVALQSALIAAGFDIPAISSGAAAKGYFGSQTKAAVMQYQASKGVPATGFVGPLTRAALNGTAVATTVACPAGYVCTPTAGTAVNNTTGTDGSVSVSASTVVSSGQTVKKGETKNVDAIKLKATAGPVTVNRVDVQFSERPWLVLSQVTLKNAAGVVLATKNLSSIADVTEISVGTNYMVRFEGLGIVVTPGTDVDLVVGVTALAASDKITGQTVSVTIPATGIRTVNGIGISESVGGVALASVPGVGGATFTLSSTGSTADISTRVNPSAPATEVSKTVSATVSTSDVTLGIFDIKAANNSATLNSVALDINTDPDFAMTGLFSNLRLKIGSMTYGAASFTAAGLATFNDLSVALAQDNWVTLTLVADISATSTNVKASSTLDASTIAAIDANYNASLVGGVAMASASNDQTSANTLLTINSMSLSAASGRVTQEVKVSDTTVAGAVAYTFTLTNNSNNSLYVSKTVSTFISATTTVPASNASSTISAISPVSAIAGDSTATYIIPTGSSRTFTVTGLIQKSSGTVKLERLSVTGIQYGTSASTGTGTIITSGLETLYAEIII